MTLWERFKDILRKINAHNGKGLSISAGENMILITKETEMQGPNAGRTTRFQRMSLTPDEVQWLSNQFTRIFAEEEKV